MDEKNIERKIDDFGAKVDKWYSSLPLAVKLLGDIICLGVILYIGEHYRFVNGFLMH